MGKCILNLLIKVTTVKTVAARAIVEIKILDLNSGIKNSSTITAISDKTQDMIFEIL